MNSVAYVMEEVEPDLYEGTENYLKTLRSVLSQANYSPRSCGIEHCPPDVVLFYQTQTNMRYPFRAAFMDQFIVRMKMMLGDMIVTTEFWHMECFKGLIRDGIWKGMRVINLERYENESAEITRVRVSLVLSEFTRCQSQSALKTHKVLETTLS